MDSETNSNTAVEATVVAAVVTTEWWCIDLGQAVDYSPLKLEELAEGFLRFTPDVVMGRNRIFLEMSRTRKLFRMDWIQKRVGIIANRAGVEAKFWQWGRGKTIPEARVQCRWRSLESKLLPIEAMFDFIDPFSHFAMSRGNQEKANLFLALGIKNIEDLFRVPHDALLVRFGEMLDLFSRNFYEGSRIGWNRFTPKIDLAETTKWNADEWVIDSESLIFAIKPLVDHLMSRLYSQRKALRVLELKMLLDSKSPDRVLKIAFTFPQTSGQFLLKFLREKIAQEMQKNPLVDPIMNVTLKVIEASPRDQRSLSFAFSDRNSEFSEDLREKWLELISYLGTAFQVETTEHPLPEKSWRKIQVASPSLSQKLDKIAHLFVKRPLKLYSIPIFLSRVGGFLKRNGELWRIQEVSCEEKLAGHEWDTEDSFDRTYYRVKVESAEKRTEKYTEKYQEEWWIYKDEIRHQLMLHGVYGFTQKCPSVAALY